jgi:hypothetical protein
MNAEFANFLSANIRLKGDLCHCTNCECCQLRVDFEDNREKNVEDVQSEGGEIMFEEWAQVLDDPHCCCDAGWINFVGDGAEQRLNNASSIKAGGQPEFWVYDEKHPGELKGSAANCGIRIGDTSQNERPQLTVHRDEK